MRARSVIFFLLTAVLPVLGFGQKKYSTKTGEIDFTSNAQLEMIKASSNKVMGRLDPATNQYAFSVRIQTFQGFNTELQRQHFNENYLQSDQFPKASFLGKIIEEVDYTKDGTYDVRAKGTLDIHGQKQTRIIRSKLTVKGETVIIDSQFTVPLADHNISIPKIVNQKIATEIEVHFNATLPLEP